MCNTVIFNDQSLVRWSCLWMLHLLVKRKCWSWWKSSKYKSYSSPSNKQAAQFASNTDLLHALKPIVDAISPLESPYSTIATIYLTTIQLYDLYTRVKGNNFADHVKTSLPNALSNTFVIRFSPFQYLCGPNTKISVYLKTMVQIG